MGLSIVELVAGVLAANLMTFGFVWACIQAEKKPGFNHPWPIWGAIIMPLLFIAAGFIAAGAPSPPTGG